MNKSAFDFDWASVFEAGLSQAAGHLRAAQKRVARGVAAERAAVAGAIFAFSTAILLLVCRFESVSLSVAGATAGFGLIFCIVFYLASRLYISRSRGTSSSETAERLDLAARNHNSVATALDLLHGKQRSVWVDRAVVEGLAVLKRCKSIPPATPVPVPARRGSLAAVSLGAVAIVLAWSVPLPLSRHLDVDRLPRITSPSMSALKTPAASYSTTSSKRSAFRTASGSAALSASATASGQPVEANPSDDRFAVVDAAGSGGWVASAGGTGGQSAGGQESDQAVQDIEPPVAGSIPAQGDTPALQTMSFGSTSADDVRLKSTPSGLAGGASSDASRGFQRSSSNADSGGSAADAKSDMNDPTDSKAGNGTTDKAQKGDTGRGSNMASGDGVGGNGQSGGQSPPKKTRGVESLMLGSLLPDLVEGRKLPGPDERTKQLAPPRPTPEKGAPAAASATRERSESAIDNYRIPAPDRDVVVQYFRQFHQDADAASASTGGKRIQ